MKTLTPITMIGLATLLIATGAQAVQYSGTGEWGVAGNWGGVLPSSGVEADIGAWGATASVTISDGASYAAGDTYVGFGPGGNGTLDISSGTLSVAGLRGNVYGNGGNVATFIQSGGSVVVGTELLVASAGTGSYTLSGGTLTQTAGTTFGSVGGTATFVQTGGATANFLTLKPNYGGGYNGVYQLQGGTLNVATIENSAGASRNPFQFTGGTLNVATFYTAGSGTGDPRFVNAGGALAPGGIGVVGTTQIYQIYSPSGYGSYDQTTGTLSLDIASLSSFDKVLTGDTASLAGLVHVNLLGGYTPNIGDTFDVLVTGSATPGHSQTPGLTLGVLTVDNDFTASVVGGSTLRLTYAPASDTTPPVWAGGWPKADTATTNGFTVRAKVNEAGNAYYVVVTNGAAAPSTNDVKNGTANGGGAALANGSILLTANTESNAVVTGLAVGSTFDAYFVAQDSASNLQSSVTNVPVSTLFAPDTTPPIWASSYPKADGASLHGFTVRARIDEAGTAYYVVVTNGAPPPSTNDVRNGTANGGAALANGSIVLAANTESNAVVSGLAASSAYDVYVIAQDIALNLQTTVTNIEVSTLTAMAVPAVTSGALIIGLDASSYDAGTGVWTDQSGYGNNFAQSGSLPIPTTNASAGIQYVHFGGTALLQRPAGLGSALYTGGGYDPTKALTFMAVLKNVTDPIGLFDSGPGQGGVIRFYGGGTVEKQGAFGVTLSCDGGPSIVTVTFTNSAALSVYKNGSLAGSNTGGAGDATISAPVIGGINLGANGSLNGDIAALLLYAGTLSETDRTNVEAYLISHYTPQATPTIALPAVSSGRLLVGLDAANYSAATGLWPDQSGYGNDFVTNGVAGVPTSITTNGLPWVRFDAAGGADLLQRPVAELTRGLESPADAFTFFAVTRNVTDPLGLFDSAPNLAGSVRCYGGSTLDISGIGLSPITLGGTNATVLAVTFVNSSAVAAYTNGLLAASGSASYRQAAFQSSALGGINLGSAGSFSGDLSVVLLYAGQLSTADRQAVEAYLQSHYSPVDAVRYSGTVFMIR